MSMFLHRANLSNQMLHNYSAILHELSHSLSQPPNLFTQIYLPYLWHFTTLETGEIDKKISTNIHKWFSLLFWISQVVIPFRITKDVAAKIFQHVQSLCWNKDGVKTRLVRGLFVPPSSSPGWKEEQKIAVVRGGPGREHLGSRGSISSLCHPFFKFYKHIFTTHIIQAFLKDFDNANETSNLLEVSISLQCHPI